MSLGGALAALQFFGHLKRALLQLQLQLFLHSIQKIHKKYYAQTESRARKAGTVQKHKKKHQHLIVIMISKYNIVEDTHNRKKNS